MSRRASFVRSGLSFGVEREVIRERTNAGLAAARARGRKGGRPFKLDPKKAAMARQLLQDPKNTVKDGQQNPGSFASDTLSLCACIRPTKILTAHSFYALLAVMSQ